MMESFGTTGRRAVVNAEPAAYPGDEPPVTGGFSRTIGVDLIDLESAKTIKTLGLPAAWPVDGSFGSVFTTLNDLDSDGMPEFILATGHYAMSNIPDCPAILAVYSGATGSHIYAAKISTSGKLAIHKP
jgi:hypothetical protein